MDPMILTYMAYLPLAGGMLAAVGFDLRSRRIPNELCVMLWAMGFAFQGIAHGQSGLADALLSSALGLGALLPFYLLGGFGAGDVKLMAAAGAWLSVPVALVAVVATLLVGGVLGLVVAIWLLVTRLTASPGVIAGLAMTAPRSLLSVIRGARFPYAIAIAAGVAIALAWRDGGLQ